MSRGVLVVRSGVIPFSEGRDLPVEVVEKSSHHVEPVLEGQDALDESADLAIFTSQIAVRRLFEENTLAAKFRTALGRGRVAAVGRATAEALRASGVSPDLVAGGAAEAILDRLPLHLSGSRVILPRGSDANDELPDELARRGAHVAPLVLYRKVPRPADPEIEQGVERGAFAAFFPSSPSAALWLFSGLSPGGMNRLRRIPAAVLGRFTQRYLEAHGIDRVEVAREATFAAAAELLVRLAGGGHPS
jgi:uroporphyrinogen III methyltransferase/synthase